MGLISRIALLSIKYSKSWTNVYLSIYLSIHLSYLFIFLSIFLSNIYDLDHNELCQLLVVDDVNGLAKQEDTKYLDTEIVAGTKNI